MKPILFFDTCAFHPPVPEELAASLALLKLDREGVVSVQFSHATEKEAMKAPGHVPAETVGRLYTMDFVDLNSQELETRCQI